MFSFDHKLFINTLDKAIEENGFKVVFTETLIPFLTEIGYLWQINTIDPSHERFISELVKQRVFVEIDREQRNFKMQTEKRISLFLPLNETHEIGLLYAHYIVLKQGFRTVYLGNNIPLESLSHVIKHHSDILFLTYLTTEPKAGSLSNFFEVFLTKVAKNKNCELLCLGSRAKGINRDDIPKRITIIETLKEFEDKLSQLKNE